MTRIFFSLALFSLVLLLAALVLGLSIGDLDRQADEPTRALFRLHFLTGVSAALAVVFVDSIVVTYFIGTSRWCKEVVLAYSLDPALTANSARLKRRAFPWALAAMLTVVGVSALGAASDPGTATAGRETWAVLHLVAALAGAALVAWSYFVLWTYIDANHRIIAQVMKEVRRIRQEKGLDAT